MLTGVAIFTFPTGDGTAILRGHREPREGLARCLVSFPVRNDPGRPVNHTTTVIKVSGGSRGGTQAPAPLPPLIFLNQTEPEGPKNFFFLRPPPSPLSKGLDPLLKVPNMIF